MFNSESFTISLETELKLRIMTDEIDSCTDIDVLKKTLKETTRLVATYQQVIGTIAKDVINSGLTNWIDKIEENNS